MHPAPLAKIPPKEIKAISSKLGAPDGVNHKDHPAGINRIILPVGLSQRNNWMKPVI